MSYEPSQSAEDWQNRLTFGTYRTSGEALATQLQQAIAVGFTRFDTAQMYRNERTVGTVLRNAFGTDCDDKEHKLHITTKVSRHEYPHVAAARLRKSADALGLSGRRLNRVLLHRPMPCDQYRLLEDMLPRDGAPSSDDDDAKGPNIIVDEIGVSNYTEADLLTLIAVARVKPCVNQVEFHPFVPGARQLLSFCNEHGIPLQAHTVLAQAKFMAYPPLVAMARRKHATPAQILLRFALDNGVDAVVGSSCPDHLAELVAAASNPNWRLDPIELAEMFTWSIAATGAPTRFYNRYGRVPPVAHLSTSTDIDEYVAHVAESLLRDLRLTDKAGNIAEVSMDAFSDTLQSLPTGFSARAINQDPISLQIATRMFPESRDPLACYRQAVKTLRAASLMKEKSTKELGRGRTCSLRSRHNHPHRVEGMLTDNDSLNQTAVEVLEPVAMPVTVSSRSELEPMLQFIESSETGQPLSPGAQFIRGTLFADGRMDMCKQVVGSTNIGALCAAVARAPPGKVRHFLLGNNVCCEGSAMEGADALASLIVDKHQTIQTWYLAGNAIDSDSIGPIARAFQQNDSADALWLKRNPIKAQGAVHLGSMLLVNRSLQLLDLDNTGILDDGVAALLNPLIASKQRVHLRHLYLGANGITDKGAETISRFIEAHPYALETLYLQMNPLESSGAVRIANALTRAAASLYGTTPALKRLSLASCRLDDTALTAITLAAEACGLVCLDVGYYKSTRALGERPNVFSSEGSAQLAQLARKCLDLRFLGVAHAGCEPNLAQLRQTAQERGDLWLEDGIQDNPSVTGIGAVRGGMLRDQVRMGIRHPTIVKHIDSVYRGKI